MSLETSTNRVNAGMEWLDKHYPDHVERVNLEKLNVASFEFCPLGQASNNNTKWGYREITYLANGEWSKLTSTEVIELGFDIKGCDDTEPGYYELTREWGRAYRKRMES